ncbi:hypothetical protein B0H16DRAFT_967774 [Mycena metata]|uniref:Uncharacterized protein n=1 Tax=Mycena metata TaxID=1033252 RepID=A0AAD7IP38_9AGAR|nr:hypothetical protein B0H16DRAFT_967774 [Mycena metata]
MWEERGSKRAVRRAWAMCGLGGLVDDTHTSDLRRVDFSRHRRDAFAADFSFLFARALFTVQVVPLLLDLTGGLVTLLVLARFGSVQVRGTFSRTLNSNLAFGSGIGRTANLNPRSGSVRRSNVFEPERESGFSGMQILVRKCLYIFFRGTCLYSGRKISHIKIKPQQCQSHRRPTLRQAEGPLSMYLR